GTGGARSGWSGAAAHRPDGLAPTGRGPQRSGRDAGERHGAAAPGGGAGPAGSGALYLYQDQPHRSVRPAPPRHRNPGLWSGELHQGLRSPGMHGRADAEPPVAPLARDSSAMATTKRLILASGSPARRELLERAGYAFDVI